MAPRGMKRTRAPRGMKRTRKTRSLTEILKVVPSGRQTEFDKPADVLETILSRLNLRDNIRASLVCKEWLKASVTVRHSTKPPLLMYFSKFGDVHEFYNPSDRKTHALDLPELRGSKILYAKGSWLLLSRPSTWDVFFFCPYTRETVTLPKLRVKHQKIAFSSAPTSPDCLVFAIIPFNYSSIHACTCRPGDTRWTAMGSYRPPLNSSFHCYHQVVFSNALVFCLSISGQVAVFNPAENNWEVFATRAPKCTLDLSFKKRWSAKFMAEHNGEIYVVCTCAFKNPVIYRFNEGVWTEVGSLGGMTLFANDSLSLVLPDLVGKMAGNVVFPKVLLYGSRCVTYFPNRGRYYPTDQLYNWSEGEPLDSAWISAPVGESFFL